MNSFVYFSTSANCASNTFVVFQFVERKVILIAAKEGDKQNWDARFWSLFCRSLISADEILSLNFFSDFSQIKQTKRILVKTRFFFSLMTSPCM
jgi:hypothetical protein